MTSMVDRAIERSVEALVKVTDFAELKVVVPQFALPVCFSHAPCVISPMQLALMV